MCQDTVEEETRSGTMQACQSYQREMMIALEAKGLTTKNASTIFEAGITMPGLDDKVKKFLGQAKLGLTTDCSAVTTPLDCSCDWGALGECTVAIGGCAAACAGTFGAGCAICVAGLGEKCCECACYEFGCDCGYYC